MHRLRSACGVLSRHLGSGQKLQEAIPTSVHQCQGELQPMVLMDHARRSSTGVLQQELHQKRNHNLVSHDKVLSFIRSAFNKLEGKNYCWLNINGRKISFRQDGIYLVFLYEYAEDFTGYHELLAKFERVKLLQQRYPKVGVFAVQCGSSVSSVAAQTQIAQTIINEYITYPILITEEDFTNMTNGASYLLFKGSMDHFFCLKGDEEPEIIEKVIEDFTLLVPKVDCLSQEEAIKEPYVVDSFRNLFLFYPGCVSSDESGNRIFISDSNNHRIIISDGDGKILDCIGSSPGFGDGEFESAKLFRPAASYYHAAEDCLYFVDSENHAVRRADLEKRVVETVYPVSVQNSSGIWCWILDKLGLAKDVAPKYQRSDVDAIMFPWHLMKIQEDDLILINRRFETSWNISMATGEIRQVVRGSQNIIESCEQMMAEKMPLLTDLCKNWPLRTYKQTFSLGGAPCAGYVSSVASFNNCMIFYDAAGQGVLKFHRETKDISYIQFSNFGVLGLPYWVVCPLERVFSSGYSTRPWKEHIHNMDVLPGRCDIRVYIDIPVGTEVAEPLKESSVWRQARGSCAELSGSAGTVAGTEKVGVAQKWYDELDNLAFTRPMVESALQEDVLPDTSLQGKGRVHLNCAVTISPGKSEVVVSALLYLKIKKTQDNQEEQRALAGRILDCHDPGDARLKLFLDNCKDLSRAIFMKPLHLRLRLECGDYPAAVTTNETISTDSRIDVNISLD